MVLRKQRGSMIIEVMIAVILAGGSLFSLSKLSNYLTKQTTLSSQMAMATEIARQQMQGTRRDVYEKTAIATIAPTKVKLSDTFTALNAEYTQTRTVTPVAGLGTLRKVDITVAWKDVDGVNQEVNLSSYL